MNKDELIAYWIEAAEKDLPVINHLFEKSDYVWSLFLSHLVLEKILKAHFVNANGTIPPKTHDLIKLANASGIDLNDEKKAFLDLVNEFNIEARYPEEKFSLYKKCTKKFTKDNIKNVTEMYEWLKSQII